MEADSDLADDSDLVEDEEVGVDVLELAAELVDADEEVVLLIAISRNF